MNEFEILASIGLAVFALACCSLVRLLQKCDSR
jgi:hypothetical protein